jgi:hypothetical protein
MDNFDFDSTADVLTGGKASKFGTHPVKPASRIIGIVMVIAALTWLFLSVDIWQKEFDRMKLLGTYKDPGMAFVNPENLTGGLALIGSLQGFAAILLCLGIYRIIFSRKSTWLVFVVFPLAFAAIIGQALYINSVRIEVKETVLSNQHEWAEQRYGIVYDEITTRTKKHDNTTNESRNYKVQDSVTKDGETIATVCERHERQAVLFCEPGTDVELFSMASSNVDEFSSDYGNTDDSSYSDTNNDDFIVNTDDPPAGDIGSGY